MSTPRTRIFRDISELITVLGPTVAATQDRAEAASAAEAALGLVHDAAVVVVDGRIAYAGTAAELPALSSLPHPIEELSMGRRLVSPGLLDPHTHILWAGERSREFDLRNLGVSYLDIQKAGGGIRSTVRATAAAGDEALVMGMRERLGQMLRQGTTICEVKSGYGLLPAAELRLVELIVRAGRAATNTLAFGAVSPTFLCHVPPSELGPPDAPGRRNFLDELVAAVGHAAGHGADAVDVYCDEGAFTLAETERLLRAGQGAGLLLRCHAEQFTYTGAAELAASLGAASVEHVEQIDEMGVQALARAGTVATLLPGAALTLRLPWPDAWRLIRAGVPVALGTDWNPGSSDSASLPLMMALGCVQMGLSCAEAWLGVTRHAARALRVNDAGQLGIGSRGDLVVWDAERYREVCQHLGGDRVYAVYVAGQPAYSAVRR
jgi:imidazolonepropionase